MLQHRLILVLLLSLALLQLVEAEKEQEWNDNPLPHLLHLAHYTPLISATPAYYTHLSQQPYRPYALVTLFVSSTHCRVCPEAMQTFEQLAHMYERSRYNASHPHIPQHHLFFVLLDAHARATPALRAQSSYLSLYAPELAKMGNLNHLQWFEQHSLSRVPMLIILNPQLPSSLSPSDLPSPTSPPSLDFAPARYAHRMAQVAERRWKRWQKAQDALEARQAVSAQYTYDIEFAEEREEEEQEQGYGYDKPEEKKKEFVAVPNFLNQSQTVSYALRTGLDAPHFVSFLHSHLTPSRSISCPSFDGETQMERMQEWYDRWLERTEANAHQALWEAVIELPCTHTLSPLLTPPSPPPPSSSSPGKLQLLLSGLQPFLHSLLGLIVAIVFWYNGTISLLMLILLFYLWCIVGTMFSILREMPFIGMGKQLVEQWI